MLILLLMLTGVKTKIPALIPSNMRQYTQGLLQPSMLLLMLTVPNVKLRHRRILREPKEVDSVTIEWSAPDTRGKPHAKRRPLAGKRREVIGGEVQHSSVISFSERQASSLMSQGDVASPMLYSIPVLRKAKQQKRDKDLDIPEGCHPVINLTKKKYQGPHVGRIHEISMSKFHVHYYSPSQLLMYRQYVKSSYSVLIVDATGRVVRRLPTLSGDSGHIFLYLGVIRLDKNTLPVMQMLSEKQDTSSIMDWINEWQRHGAPTPREVWCDNSPALKSAFARTFCQCPDLKTYKSQCFAALDRNEPLPACFLRLDVAHFISRAAKWDCWKVKSIKRLKDFYMRSLGQLINCTEAFTWREIFKAVTLLASAPTFGYR